MGKKTFGNPNRYRFYKTPMYSKQTENYFKSEYTCMFCYICVCLPMERTGQVSTHGFFFNLRTSIIFQLFPMRGEHVQLHVTAKRQGTARSNICRPLPLVLTCVCVCVYSHYELFQIEIFECFWKVLALSSSLPFIQIVTWSPIVSWVTGNIKEKPF